MPYDSMLCHHTYNVTAKRTYILVFFGFHLNTAKAF